jgi:uncharacterized protein
VTKIVLDTNVLLRSLSDRSVHAPILDALVANRYELYLTNDIELEYQEVLQRHMGSSTAEDFLELLALLRNVHYIQRYFQFGLIVADPDDDKFVDCAIAANADFLVTDDKHFKVLAQIPFPKVEVLSAEQFLALIISEQL